MAIISLSRCRNISIVWNRRIQQARSLTKPERRIGSRHRCPSHQRCDLIPNLVETIKGYASHEKETLTAVIEARNKAMSATTLTEKNDANNAFSSTLKTLFALSESYPELKANQGFLDLQAQLQKIEESLLSARKYYNAVINDINTMIQTFPSSVVASIFSFKKLPYLSIEEAKLGSGLSSNH